MSAVPRVCAPLLRGEEPHALAGLLAGLLLLAGAAAPAQDTPQAPGTPAPPAEAAPAESTPDAAVPAEDVPVLPGDEVLLFAEEERVSAASRKVSKLSEAPGTITVLSRRRLEELGVVTLGDAIAYITSVFFFPGIVADTTEFRDIQQPFHNKILLLQDGRIVNAVYRGNFFLDLSQPIDNVRQIEIVRGPGSALYGANAFAGFINIVTRQGEEVGGVELRSAAGTDGLGLVSVSAGGRLGSGSRTQWTLAGRGAAASGPDIVNPVVENADHEDWNLEGRLHRENWFVAAGVTRVDAGVPGTFRAPTPRDTLDELRMYADGWRRFRTSRSTQMSVRATWSEARNRYQFEVLDLVRSLQDLCVDPVTGEPGIYCDLTTAFRNSSVFFILDPSNVPIPPALVLAYGIRREDLFAQSEGGDPETFVTRAVFDRLLAAGRTIERQDSDERSLFLEYQFDWKAGERNYLLAGVSARRDRVDNTGVGDLSFHNEAAFLENETRFFRSRVLLLGSVRADRHSFFGTSVSPRLSFIFVPNRRYTLKTSYGNAFRSPNFVELFGEALVGLTTEQRGNQDLEQEGIQTIEMQFEAEPTSRVRATATLFHYQIDDEVIFVVDRDKVFGFQERPPFPFPASGDLVFDPALADVPVTSTFLNVDGSRGVGAELEVESTPRDGIRLWANYSRRETRQAVEFRLEPTGETKVVSNVLIPVLQLVPRFDSFLTDQLNFGGRFALGAGFHLDARTRVIGRAGDSIFDRGARFSHDLTVGYSRGPWSVRATGLNLTGSDYLRDRTVGAVPDLEPRLLLLAGYRWELR